MNRASLPTLIRQVAAWSARQRVWSCALAATLVAGSSLMSTAPLRAQAAVTPVSLANIPLTVAIPAHPQVVFAVGNSQSMDGDLSGAIMTGSGYPGVSGGGYLANSSSPVNFTIPSGFTPPLNPGLSGAAPYTVVANGLEYDNSASRLNVAKAGLTAILDDFMEYADFGLIDYATGGIGVYATSVYYMSPSGQPFSFTDTPGTARYVNNPCYGGNINDGSTYSNECTALHNFYGNGYGVFGKKYMLIGASSDDPEINDVLYWGGGVAACVAYGGPGPANPFPPNFSLWNYNTYGVYEGYYYAEQDCGGVTETTPTNAGYVPYSPQVMYAARGFGYYTSQSSNSGNVVVGMQSAGSAPTAASTATAISQFTPYLQPETNSTGTNEIKALAVQSPIAGLVAQANNYYSTVNPPSTNGCAPSRYVVLVTDGLPTEDLSGYAWPPLGTTSANGYGVWANFNSDGSLNSTNDQALTDTINQIHQLTAAGIKTYVIGLGAGVEPANNAQAASTLTSMAVAGGTNAYFAATSPGQLVYDMQVILAQILAATQSTASATVNTTGLNTNSMAFQPSFDTSDVNQDWTGDIKAYPINPTTGLVNTGSQVWSAQTQLDGEDWDAQRVIATWDPVAQQGIPFRWSGGTPSSGIATSTTLGQQLETNTSDTSGQDALNYLRGDRLLEIAQGGPYRTRSHVLADIVDSAPLYVGPAVGPYQSSSYYAFEQTYANREPVIYVGADDGMLHAINAANGKELFAYVPHGVFSNLINLSSPFYNEQHQFFVDGSPQASDVQFGDGSWHTVLVGTERNGGQTVFGLDVTNPAAITNETALASKVLWEFSDPNMGQGYSTPAFAETAAGSSSTALGFTVFFGNGYNSASQKPYLYAINPQTGQSRTGTPIDLCAQVPTACNTSLANGLSGAVVVNDIGGVGAPATTVYAGDLQGNLWRVNVSDSNPQNWTVSVLFQAVDASHARQPITATPVVSLNPDFPRIGGTMVYVGTGQLLGIPDLASTQVQTMYGVYDSGTDGPFTRFNASLIAQTMYSPSATPNLRFVSGSEINLQSQVGWYVDFDLLSGERLVTDPRLDGGALVVTSVTPNPNTCTSGDVAYLMEFNFAGGAFSNPQFNYSGTGPVTSSLEAANGMLLGSVYASAAVFSNLAGTTNATGGGVAFVTLSGGGAGGSGSILAIAQRGLVQQRFAWWEIR